MDREANLLCIFKSFFALHMRNSITPYKDIIFQSYFLGNKRENSFVEHFPLNDFGGLNFRHYDVR